MASFDDIVKKKLFGVPVLYYAGGAVLILVIIAWRMKTTPDEDTTGVDPADGTAGTDEASNAGGLAGMTDPYGSYDTNGTITAPSATVTPVEAVQETNEDWIKKGIAYAIAHPNLKISAVDAQNALTKYVNGDDLTYGEGYVRDTIVNGLGSVPPEGVAKVGAVSALPAQKQFSHFPGKHTVKGTNDNTPTKLAQLYYGNSDSNHALEIVAKNPGLGPVGTTYTAGTVLQIPAFINPTYYTTKHDNTYASEVASLNGLAYSSVLALNPTLTWPVTKNVKVRTR